MNRLAQSTVGQGRAERVIKQHIVTLTGLPLKTGTGLSPASAWRGQRAGKQPQQTPQGLRGRLTKPVLIAAMTEAVLFPDKKYVRNLPLPLRL